MVWRSGCASVALIFIAQGAQAQPVGSEFITYEEALRSAVLEQPRVQARELQVQARREAAEAADELPDPQLSAGIMNLPVTGPEFLDPTQMTQLQVGIEQNIPNPAERRARAAIAGADIGFANAQLAHARHMAPIAAGQAWIALAYSQRALVVADEALEEVRELVPVANAAVAGGAGRPGETVEVRRALLEIADMVTAIEADREAAQALLVRFIPSEDPVADGDVPPADVDPEQLRATLERNPEIVLANAAIEQALAQVELAESEKRPDFGVRASVGLREPKYGQLFSVMGTVTLPLFAGRRQDPLIRAAEAEAAAVAAERQERLDVLEAQFEADLAEWRSAWLQWQRAVEELLPLAQERAELEMASFAAGNAELLDVIEALKALALLQIDILEREEAAVEAAAELRLTYMEHPL